MVKVMQPLEARIHGARVVRDLGLRHVGNQQGRYRFCALECPGCGRVREVRVDSARRGVVRCHPCGGTQHGFSRSRVYGIWQLMHRRCGNPESECYEYYGARGIAVCDEWSDPEAFCKWAMSNGYEKNLTIDRIDNDRGYSPDNCRWTTPAVQSRNTRRICSTNTSGYRGVTRHQPSGEWTAQIVVDRKGFNLGHYPTPEQAARVRDAYVIEKGLEHTLNFPQGSG